MCLPQVIKSFQNYRGVATTFYPTLVFIIFLSSSALKIPKVNLRVVQLLLSASYLLAFRPRASISFSVRFSLYF